MLSDLLLLHPHQWGRQSSSAKREPSSSILPSLHKRALFSSSFRHLVTTETFTRRAELLQLGFFLRFVLNTNTTASFLKAAARKTQ